jgi:Bacterial SH3 domain
MGGKMKKIIVLLGLGIMLFGCAHRQPQQPQVWVRPNSTEQEFNTDKYQCMKEVTAMTGQQSHMAYGDAGFVIASTEIARRRATAEAIAMFEACMQSKGWSKQQAERNQSPPPPSLYPKERPIERKYEPIPPSSSTEGCRLTNSPATYAIGSNVCIGDNKFVCEYLPWGVIGWRKLEENCRESASTAPEKPITSNQVTPSLGTTKILTWDFSDVKSAPGNNFSSIATVRKGDKLTIMEQSGEWVRVRLENGREGWIRSEVLE